MRLVEVRDGDFVVSRYSTVERCDQLAGTDSCANDLDYNPSTPCHTCYAEYCICARFGLVPGSRMAVNKAKEIENNGTA
jgi:hypothetical protein